MIWKKFRLKEREVKKVLQKWKPFFSYHIVLNSFKNKLDYNRFALVISSKSTKNAVERNFFRRSFYNNLKPFIFKNSQDSFCDIVFVVKNKSKFDKREIESIKSFDKDLSFLLKKKFWK